MLIHILYGREFGAEFILADWQFWEQSAKTLHGVMSSLLQHHSFHVVRVARPIPPSIFKNDVIGREEGGSFLPTDDVSL